MRVRISQIHPDRIAAVFGLNLMDTAHHFVERLLPGNLLPAASDATYRSCQPIRILIQVFQRGCFRAHISSAEDVALVAANRYDVLAVDLDLEAAHRLAQVAGAVVDGLLSAHAASIPRSGFLRITDRVDEIAARFDTLLATGELDALVSRRRYAIGLPPWAA